MAASDDSLQFRLLDSVNAAWCCCQATDLTGLFPSADRSNSHVRPSDGDNTHETQCASLDLTGGLSQSQHLLGRTVEYRLHYAVYMADT